MAVVGDLMQLTRKELNGFPEDSIRYILDLQKDKGWKVTRSNRNHLAVMSPDGKARFGLSTNPDGLKFLRRQVIKYYETTGEESVVVEAKKNSSEKVKCPRPDCYKVYASLEHLNAHIAVDHEKRIICPEPGCTETFTRPAVLGRHRQLRHNYVSPYKKTRKAQEANRAKKKLNEEGKLTEEQRESVANHILQSAEEAVKETLKTEEIVVGVEEPADDGDIKQDNLVVGRDSWTLDMSHILEHKVEDVIKMMAAAGLGVEIRVWKEDK